MNAIARERAEDPRPLAPPCRRGLRAPRPLWAQRGRANGALCPNPPSRRFPNLREVTARSHLSVPGRQALASSLRVSPPPPFGGWAGWGMFSPRFAAASGDAALHRGLYSAAPVRGLGLSRRRARGGPWGGRGPVRAPRSPLSESSRRLPDLREVPALAMRPRPRRALVPGGWRRSRNRCGRRWRGSARHRAAPPGPSSRSSA